MITRIEYCQYLLSSQTNYTITNFADHIEGLSDDKVRRYLVNAKLSPRLIWEHGKVRLSLVLTVNCYLTIVYWIKAIQIILRK
jgi:hypothetical protein